MRQRRVCATCRHVLDYWPATGKWKHSLGDASLYDHEPVPVKDSEVEDIDERCDFCYEKSPLWVVPVRSFVYLGANSAGNWAACDDCALLVAQGRWRDVLTRAKNSWVQRHGEMDALVEAGLMGLYRMLRRNQTGPPVSR